MIDLYTEIENGRRKFENEIFQPIYQSIKTDTAFLELNRLDFINCEFNFFEIEDLNQPDLTIFFKECVFNDHVHFFDVYLGGLIFVEIKKITNVDISGKFTRIRFNNKNTPLNGGLDLNVEIIQELNFEDFNQTNGKLELIVNNGNLEKKEEFRTFFKNAKFNDFFISNSNFGYIANFKNITVLSNLSFEECSFEECFFDNSNFTGEVNFLNCLFNKFASFQNLVSQNSSSFHIKKSKFIERVNFNNSKFHKLEINDNNFKELTFQDSQFNSISIDRTTFEKNVLFDDIQITNINDCNRRTIRTIKQEIQKAENRIDFNRFKNYEMATYYKELSWKKNFVDKSILYMTKISTDFGNSWTKALGFTLLSALLFFTLFFINENYFNSFDLKNWTQFTSGYFRFFLVTDFYNPLETDRVYLTNPLSWLIFVFGKIVIAFGIYEMIQSFRKFKA